MDINKKIVALGVCAVIGIGMALPTIGAAASGYTVADLAQQALKLNGFGASATPKANTLVPTGSNGRLPLGVIPKSVLTSGDISRPGDRSGQLIAADTTGKIPAKLLPDLPVRLVPDLPASKLPSSVLRADGVNDGVTMTGTIGSETSVWAATTVVNYGATATFPAPVKVAPDNVHMGVNGGNIEDPACQGTFENPTAPAGHLCIYPGVTANGASGDNLYSDLESELANITLNGDQALNVNAYPLNGGAGLYGFRVDIQGKCAAASTTNSGPGQTTVDDTHPCTSKFFATWAYTAGVAEDPSDN